MTATAIFFPDATAFRAWLQRHHATAGEITLGFHNRSSGRGGITYAEALDEALCFGWIDGLIRKIDAQSHSRRFTPRRPGSIWSNVNVRHVERLKAAGRMQPAGLAAYTARSAAKTGVYSFENRPQEFSPELKALFRRQPAAWKFWLAQPPGYRRVLLWWVMSAKREETRQRRLRVLIAESAAQRRIDMMKPPSTSRTGSEKA